MSDKKNQPVVYYGIGFTKLLTIVFIVLKLTHYIDWSWWWVLSPLWIEFGIAILMCLICIPIIIYLEKNK